MVVGHYGCGGVTAAWQEQVLGLVDNWLQPIRDVAHLYRESLLQLPTKSGGSTGSASSTCCSRRGESVARRSYSRPGRAAAA